MKCVALAILVYLLPVVINAEQTKGWTWSATEEREIAKLAKKARKSDGLSTVESANWITKTRFDARFTAEASVYIEILTKTVLTSLGRNQRFPSKDRPEFYVLGSVREYASTPGVPPGSAGVFMYRLTSRIGGLRLYTFYSGKKSNPSFTECPPMTIHVIQHEGTHAIIRRVFGTVAIPVALNEGFATYFEAVNLRLRFQAIGNDKAAQNAKLERRANSKRIAYLRRTIDKFELNPPGIRYLLGLDQKTTWAPDGLGAKCAAHYALSESFIDFLTDTACGRYALMALRKRLARKQTPLFSDTTLNTLEPEWHKFLAQKWKIPIRRKSAGKKRANARR